MTELDLNFASEAAPADVPANVIPRKVTYTLRYDEDALGLPKMGEAEGRRALLLADGEPLCQLVKAAADPAPYWIVARDSARHEPAGGAIG
jgi:hypothetical protein